MLVEVIIAIPRKIHGTHTINVPDQHSLIEVRREIIKLLQKNIQFEDNNINQFMIFDRHGLYSEVDLRVDMKLRLGDRF